MFVHNSGEYCTPGRLNSQWWIHCGFSTPRWWTRRRVMTPPDGESTGEFFTNIKHKTNQIFERIRDNFFKHTKQRIRDNWNREKQFNEKTRVVTLSLLSRVGGGGAAKSSFVIFHRGMILGWPKARTRQFHLKRGFAILEITTLCCTWGGQGDFSS